jgi:hypothetical protein
MSTTNHETAIEAMRDRGTIEDCAAADLLELHDRTGLNLHEAPNLLQFVQDYATSALDDGTFTVINNGA